MPGVGSAQLLPLASGLFRQLVDRTGQRPHTCLQAGNWLSDQRARPANAHPANTFCHEDDL